MSFASRRVSLKEPKDMDDPKQAPKLPQSLDLAKARPGMLIF